MSEEKGRPKPRPITERDPRRDDGVRPMPSFGSIATLPPSKATGDPPETEIVDTTKNNLLAGMGLEARVGLDEPVTEMHAAVLFGLAPEPARPSAQAKARAIAADVKQTTLPPPASASAEPPAQPWNGPTPPPRPMTPYATPFNEGGLTATLAERAPILLGLLRLTPLAIAAAITAGFLYLFIVKKPSSDPLETRTRTRAEVNKAIAEAARSKSQEEILKRKIAAEQGGEDSAEEVLVPVSNSDPTPHASVVHPTEPVRATASRPPPDLSQKVRIVTEPSDAEVELDGIALGRTPLAAPKPGPGDKLRFRLLRTHYATWEGQLAPDPKAPEHLKLLKNNGQGEQELGVDEKGHYRLLVKLRAD